MKKLFTAFFLFALLGAGPLLSAQVLYVDKDATGGSNNGSNWANAFTDLQTALANADPNDTIWVAEGIYKPVSQNAYFNIEKDLVLLGGFSANGNERDPVAFPTILSGDLEDDDIPNNFVTNRDDNASTVLRVASNITDATLIEGFTIRNGHAPGSTPTLQGNGGGMYNSGDPVLRQCTFLQNFANRQGGGIYSSGGDIQLESCNLNNNRSSRGGAAYIEDGQIMFLSDTFSNNSTFDGLDYGSGGAINLWDVSGSVAECVFLLNDAAGWGGGLNINTSSLGTIEMSVSGCQFEDNSAGESGGGINFQSYAPHSIIILRGCEFSDNTAEVSGGGAAGGSFNSNVQLDVVSCDFLGNIASVIGGGLYMDAQSDQTHMLVDSCLFEQNQSTGDVGGLHVYLKGGKDSLEVSHSTFLQNTSASFAGGMGILGTSPVDGGSAVVHDCDFIQNTALYDGGLIIGNNPGAGFHEYAVFRCNFIENEAQFGGGLNLYGEAPGRLISEYCHLTGNIGADMAGGLSIVTNTNGIEVIVRYAIMEENISAFGSAIGVTPALTDLGGTTQNADISLENCLITGNHGETSAVAIRKTGNVLIRNLTIADNTTGGIFADSNSVVKLQNTILHNPGYPGVAGLLNGAVLTSMGGNLLGDASLGSLATATITDQQSVSDPGLDSLYKPASAGSPVVDAGIYSSDLPEFDLAGNVRIVNCVDIGAYESEYEVAEECPSSTKEILIPEQLTLSPNPVTHLLNITWPENFFWTGAVSLFDVQGFLVLEQNVSEGQPLSVGHLAPGLYTLKLTGEKVGYAGKFVKL